ncbi:hypothetical protein D3C85_1379080 [compost metagenome]
MGIKRQPLRYAIGKWIVGELLADRADKRARRPLPVGLEQQRLCVGGKHHATGRQDHFNVAVALFTQAAVQHLGIETRHQYADHLVLTGTRCVDRYCHVEHARSCGSTYRSVDAANTFEGGIEIGAEGYIQAQL